MTKEQQLEHALNTIRSYCDDIIKGKHTLEPNENPLMRIQSVAHLAVSGLWTVVEEENAGESADTRSA